MPTPEFGIFQTVMKTTRLKIYFWNNDNVLGDRWKKKYVKTIPATPPFQYKNSTNLIWLSFRLMALFALKQGEKRFPNLCFYEKPFLK